MYLFLYKKLATFISHPLECCCSKTGYVMVMIVLV